MCPMNKPQVVLYQTIHQQGLDLLQQKAKVTIAPQPSEEVVLGLASEAEGMIIRAVGKVTSRLMEAAPKLKVIGRHGVGLEAIDVEEATRRGIYVTNTPEANTESVAEHVVGMIIDLSKLIAESDRAVRRGNWEFRYTQVGREVQGTTVGIIGLGRIGRRIAQICQRAFDMEIIYHDLIRHRDLEQEQGCRFCELEELLREADFVSVNVPLTPETHHLIGAEQLALMKPTSFLINAARGAVVEEAALLAALQQGGIAGAGLDVLEQDPPPHDHPFFQLENVLITPHSAALTEEAMVRMATEVAQDVIRVLEGKEPLHPANAPRRSRRSEESP